MATTGNPQAIMDFDWGSNTQEAGAADPLDDFSEPVAAPESKAPAGAPEGRGNLELLLDIPLEITAELGRTRMIINDLLQFGQGSVIELNKLAGEPVDILVNQKLIARGEVVVVNEKFGIRLTDIISPIERIKQLA